MTIQKTLTVLYKGIICGLAMYAISMSLAYAGDVGQEWCDPRFCCPLTTEK
jgi:hypothetical protein